MYMPPSFKLDFAGIREYDLYSRDCVSLYFAERYAKDNTISYSNFKISRQCYEIGKQFEEIVKKYPELTANKHIVINKHSFYLYIGNEQYHIAEYNEEAGDTRISVKRWRFNTDEFWPHIDSTTEWSDIDDFESKLKECIKSVYTAIQNKAEYYLVKEIEML